MRIGLFATCLGDTLFPDAVLATALLLARLGHEVVFPPEQTCCGQMHVNTGYQREPVPLVRNFAEKIEQAEQLSGHPIDVVHLVGGGSRNALLCQLTADACGVPVIAGPVEAAALGNALVQARTLGALSGGLDDLRALLRRTQPLRRYEPTGDPAAWSTAAHLVQP